MHKIMTLLGATACLVAVPLVPAGSADVKPVEVAPGLEERFSGTDLQFALKGDFHNVTVTVAGPDRYSASAYSQKGVPTVRLEKFGSVRDGAYRYQITAATAETVEIATPLDNGRGDAERRMAHKPWSFSGVFHVVDGRIRPNDLTPEPEKRSK